MDSNDKTGRVLTRPVPWDKGKIIGQKPPLRPKHVSAIRTSFARRPCSGSCRWPTFSLGIEYRRTHDLWSATSGARLADVVAQHTGAELRDVGERTSQRKAAA